MFTEERRARLELALTQRLADVRVVVEALHHRHNTSAILRTADACGVQDVHLITERFVPSNATARGTQHWLDLRLHADEAEALAALRADGFAVWIADFADDGVPPEEVPVDRPIALWFGAEYAGVHPIARAQADGVMTLPMVGLAQSLNVSAAAAIATYVVTRRVRARGGGLIPAARQAKILEGWLSREVDDDWAAVWLTGDRTLGFDDESAEDR
jgi:tRNA (guanosine-2'-O-)-methyltransferase